MINSSEVLAKLEGWRFPASAVMRATGLNPASLSNTLSKTPLILCSESAGQGRARQYCLVDAYQLALMNRLSHLTGRVAWSANVLNRFLFSEIYAEGPRDESRVEEWDKTKALKVRFCADIGSLPAAYRHRGEQPWFFFASVRNVISDFAHLGCAQWGSDDDRLVMAVLNGGVFVNITYLLESVDADLANFMGLAGDA